MAKKLSRVQLARRISLGFFLVLTTGLALMHQLQPGWPSIDGLCPFGGLETLYAWVAGGSLLKNIFPGNLVLLAAIIALGVVLGRFFCGWICALGTLQGVFGWLGRKLFRRRFDLPARLDGILRYLKYVVLALVLFFTWQTGSLVIRSLDPWAAWGHLGSGWTELWGEFAIGLLVLAATLVLSLFSDRVFCKYVCPLGAFNALLGHIPLFRIRREAVTCTSCRLCDRKCPMRVDVSTVQTVKQAECIGCLECVTVCPTNKATLQPNLARRPLPVWLVPVIGLGIYLAAIGVGQALGMARFGPVPLTERAGTGQLQIADIKGSSTWADIAAAFGVEVAELMREAGVDAALVPADSMIKNAGKLAGITGYEADVVRQALARLTGLPYAGESGHGAVTPAPAAVLTAAPAAPPADPAGQVPATGATPAVAPAKTAADPAPAKTAAAAAPVLAPAALVVPPDFELEGTMSLQDVARELQADPVLVIRKLELPADIPLDRPLRELKDQYGYTMPSLKTRIHQP